MSILKIKRGLEVNRTSFTPSDGELILTTDEKKLYVGDGLTVGGVGIQSSGNSGNVTVTSSGTGYKVLSNGMFAYGPISVSFAASQTKNIVLPIANNNGQVISYSFGGGNFSERIKFSSITTTSVTMVNDVAIPAYGDMFLIAI